MKYSCSAVVVALLNSVVPAAAQTVVQIGQRPTCSECKVDFQPVALLGDINDPAGFGQVVQVAANSRGEYAVSSHTFVGEVFIYGADGKLKKAIGRRGEGPGEFSRPQYLDFGAADSLHTIDTSGPKYSVFAPDYSFVRATQLGTRTAGFLIETSGQLYIVAPKVGQGSAMALQVFSPKGEALHAFDPIDPDVRGPASFRRLIAVDAAGMRWSIGMGEYVLKQWDRNGRLVRRLEARRSWIPDSIPMRLMPDQKPPAQISGIDIDASGRAWVYVAVPDAKWKAPAQDSPPDTKTMFDTLIEVVDLSTGELLATGSYDPLILPIGNGRAYSMVEDELGDLKIQIWKTGLAGH